MWQKRLHCWQCWRASCLLQCSSIMSSSRCSIFESFMKEAPGVERNLQWKPQLQQDIQSSPKHWLFQLHKFMLSWLTGDRNSIDAVQLHEEDCLGAICHLWDFLCGHMLVFNTWLCTLVMNELHYHHRKVSAWLGYCIIMIGNSTILASEIFWLVEFSITISYHRHCHKYIIVMVSLVWLARPSHLNAQAPWWFDGLVKLARLWFSRMPMNAW